MRYFCICMAPAIDVTVAFNRIPEDGEIVKDSYDHTSPGGKGVNVARWLAIRGAFVTCGGLLGSYDSTMFRHEFGRYGIGDRFTTVEGPVRRNETFLAPGYSFKLNRPAYPGLVNGGCHTPQSDIEGAVVIISGALPANFKSDYYAKLIERLRKLNPAKIALDTSGEAMREGVKAKPDIIKPNADECEALVGFRPTTKEDFLRATKILRESVPDVLISDGANGCWFNGELVPAPQVQVLDTTASGDILLAEYCFSRDREFAVMAASAACALPGGEPPVPWLNERKEMKLVPKESNLV